LLVNFTADSEDEKDSKLRNKVQNLSTSPKLVPGSSAVGSSASHETLNQSFGLPRFPLNQSIGPFTTKYQQQLIGHIKYALEMN
jgi:hypothetical protein